MNNLDHISGETLVNELRKRLHELDSATQTQQSLLADLQDMNDRLRDVERVKSGFLSNIRNEINNPLTAILGLSGQIASDAFDPESVKRMARLINKEAFSLDFQLRNIYSAADIEAGEIMLQPSLVNLKDLIQSQIHYFSTKLVQKQVTVDYESSSHELFITDLSLLTSIIMNLLSNAIEYSPFEGKVKISAIVLNNGLVLTVRDSGQGIDEANRKQIFERFKQLDAGTTKHHLGHGLGLSIVKEFTDALRGDIQMESDSASGTLVTITLPGFEDGPASDGFSKSGGQELLFDDPEIF